LHQAGLTKVLGVRFELVAFRKLYPLTEQLLQLLLSYGARRVVEGTKLRRNEENSTAEDKGSKQRSAGNSSHSNLCHRRIYPGDPWMSQLNIQNMAR
jgi:hypothetical protein